MPAGRDSLPTIRSTARQHIVGVTSPEIVTTVLLHRHQVQMGMRTLSNFVVLREPSSKPSKSQEYFDLLPKLIARQSLREVDGMRASYSPAEFTKVACNKRRQPSVRI